MLLLLDVAARAQGMTTFVYPKFKTHKPGSYQLADGSWQTGKLFLEEGGAALSVRETESKERVQYAAGIVTRFVVDADTFGVARDFDQNSRLHVARAFGKQLYRTPYHILYLYQGPSVGDNPGGHMLVLQPANGPAVLVPQGRANFTEAMLPQFGRCPEVAKGIEGAKLGPQHMKRIMTTYAQWARSQPAPAR
ncbi:hypothetical protein GCM10027048_24920 [Hymenobacter coalescens]